MTVANMLLWSLIGGFAGWLASLITRDNMGTIGDIVVGVLGALICGFILSLLLPDSFGFTSFNGESLPITFLGAFFLLLIIRLSIGAKPPS